MKRTDKNKITWPQGTSSEDRRFARNIISTLANELNHKGILIACSGGLDSTVLAHAYAQARVIGGHIDTSLMYINHNLRPQEEIQKDIDHVNILGKELNMDVFIQSVKIKDGNTQLQAREERYNALIECAQKLDAIVFLAHHANDVAESKLFQFISGREVIGIKRVVRERYIWFVRPLLPFTKDDLERYAEIWNLDWSEDSSNDTDKYTRNKIRHHLIPWIEKEMNPGIVRMLSND